MLDITTFQRLFKKVHALFYFLSFILFCFLINFPDKKGEILQIWFCHQLNRYIWCYKVIFLIKLLNSV